MCSGWEYLASSESSPDVDSIYIAYLFQDFKCMIIYRDVSYFFYSDDVPTHTFWHQAWILFQRINGYGKFDGMRPKRKR